MFGAEIGNKHAVQLYFLPLVLVLSVSGSALAIPFH